ncbi:MAG: tetratricopeptide repeat protein [Proteobacteria bacterium]|nr:tetratricopeptide repeat protein [Pseudomonadota bacterium]
MRRWKLFLLAVCLPGPMLAVPMLAGPVLAAAAQSAAERQAAIDKLLDALKAAPSEQVAAPLEARFAQMMVMQGTPAVTLLLARGVRELRAGAPQDALEDLDAAVTLQPDFAEAYRQRAIARFQSGDTQGAIADISKTLEIQPRNFEAFRTLAQISEAREDWKGAYEAWQKLMELDPKTPGGEQRLNDLRRRALGDET